MCFTLEQEPNFTATKLFPSPWQPQPIAPFFNVLKGGKLASLKVFFFQKYIMKYGETGDRRRGPTLQSNSETGLLSCFGRTLKVLRKEVVFIASCFPWYPRLARDTNIFPLIQFLFFKWDPFHWMIMPRNISSSLLHGGYRLHHALWSFLST